MSRFLVYERGQNSSRGFMIYPKVGHRKSQNSLTFVLMWKHGKLCVFLS